MSAAEHPRLARSLAALSPAYDAVIVGSGYGGAVAALRLAAAGLRVAVLERGRELVPGEFPTSERAAMPEIELETPLGRIGRKGALYRFHAGGAMNVFTGSGLGGGSLINAGVFLRPDPRVFDDPRWPKAFRDDVNSRLEKGYRDAEEMLQPAAYPANRPVPPKLAAFEKAAATKGLPVLRPKLTIAFEDGKTAAGVEKRACTSCGECCTGCNVGAKTTLASTYLAEAVRHGAHVFTESDVRHVSRENGRWLVHFDALGREREAYDAPGMWVAAELVVLAAGAVGSTALLARSKAAGLACSERLGERFSGNGDVLAFAFDGPEIRHTHGTPGGSASGPCITGSLEIPGPRGGPGFYLQDGAHPSIANGAMRAVLPALDVQENGVFPALRGAIAKSPAGRHDRTLHWLSMGPDEAKGRVVVDGDRVRIEWPDRAAAPHVERVHEAVRELTQAVGGTFVTSSNAATVHPLGGCAMAETAEDGVVDHRGRVFAGRSGSAVHEGLFVLDGSILPVAIGANPLATIAAVSERACALLLEDRRTRRAERREIPANHAPKPLTFSERMAGPVARAVDQADLGTMELYFTIEVPDVDALADDPGLPSNLFGSVRAPGLSDRPLILTGGRFRMLARDPDGGHRMIYAGLLAADDGRTWFFEGRKRVLPEKGGFLEGWHQTTHLDVTLRLDAPDGPLFARGTLLVGVVDFAKLVLTARGAAAPYFSRFLGRMVDTYTPLLDPKGIYDRAAPLPALRALRAPPAIESRIRTADGRELRLTRHRGDGPPVVLVPGYSASSRLFALETNETSLVEHLCAEGRDVWLFDWRSSPRIADSHRPFTLDEVARFDHPAAIAAIRAETGRPVDVVAHCIGAQTVVMALLGGHVAKEHVGSLVLLQVAAHFAGGKLLNAKVRSGIPAVLDTLGLTHIDASVDSADGLGHRLLDVFLKAWPVDSHERCDNGTCRRMSLLFGDLTRHANVNAATHARYAEFFGPAAVRGFRQLATITRAGALRDFAGRDAYLPHLGRLALPITFIHGANNLTAHPETTGRTFRLLCDANGTDLYRRYVVDGYGHLDTLIGERAGRDVYPLVSAGLSQGGRRDEGSLPRAGIARN